MERMGNLFRKPSTIKGGSTRASSGNQDDGALALGRKSSAPPAAETKRQPSGSSKLIPAQAGSNAGHGSASGRASPAGSAASSAGSVAAPAKIAGSSGRIQPASASGQRADDYKLSSSPLGSSASSSSSHVGGGGGGGGGGTTSRFRSATHIGSVVDDWPMYSSLPQDYIIGSVIGLGASSVVYQAAFQPLGGRACAVKVIDLEAFGGDTEVLRRETQLMSLSKHPNVLRVRGCWVEGSKLHIATRLMSSGSMLDIMRFNHPDGFDETVIATILKQALEGLNYLHINGWLHR